MAPPYAPSDMCGMKIPVLGINVGGNRGILSEITMDGVNNAIEQIIKGNIFFG